jgi:BON domain
MVSFDDRRRIAARRALRGAASAVVALAGALSQGTAAQGRATDVERRNWFDTPFDQAVGAIHACPRPLGPLITEQEMRTQAHGRIERGTSCWLAKKCEDSNVYKRDPEIQQRVLQAIRADARFARSSVWVTTERRYVTLQGCVGSASEQRALVARVVGVDGVEHVFDQLIIGTRSVPRWPLDPTWPDPKRR